MNKTLENLEVGELIKNENGYFLRVLGVITPNNGELTTYIISLSSLDINSDNLKRSAAIWTAFELKENGYSVYSDTEVEKAMDVLIKAGKIVDGKIIK